MTAVDMRGLDVEKLRRLDRFGKADEEPHRERRRVPSLAREQGFVDVG